jgi:hypothetical protein
MRSRNAVWSRLAVHGDREGPFVRRGREREQSKRGEKRRRADSEGARMDGPDALLWALTVIAAVDGPSARLLLVLRFASSALLSPRSRSRRVMPARISDVRSLALQVLSGLVLCSSFLWFSTQEPV